MAISLYLSNKNVHAVVGSGSMGSASVSACYSDMLIGDSLVNGVITNAPALRDELESFLDAKKIHGREISLVINSTLMQLKTIEYPKMNEKQIKKLIENSFSDVADRVAPLYDYMQLKDKNGNLNRAIACCCEKSFVESYINLFKELKIKVVSFNAGVAALVKLIEFMPEFREKTSVVVVVDGQNVQNILLENGEYKISTRTRLFSDSNTDAMDAEMQRNLSQMVQFLASEKSSYVLTDAYFCGTTTEELMRFSAFGADMGIAIREFPDDRRIKFSSGDKTSRLSNYAYSVGDLLRK